MFHPESNPLAPKSIGPKKPEKELVEIWLGKEAAELMEDEKSEMGAEDLNTTPAPTLTEKEKRTLWEMKRPDEVTLRNIPEWKELPDAEAFERDFKFDKIWEREYCEGRPLTDFSPFSEETLPSLQGKETLPHAKVFDITDAIAKAQRKDPKHPDTLTTAEVLEAINQAGYRPATFEELLAYARDYWKPDADPTTLTKEERDQNAQAPRIYSLCSVFSDSESERDVPLLFWHGAERALDAYDLESDWDADYRFLVLRKSSPS